MRKHWFSIHFKYTEEIIGKLEMLDELGIKPEEIKIGSNEVYYYYTCDVEDLSIEDFEKLIPKQ